MGPDYLNSLLTGLFVSRMASLKTILLLQADLVKQYCAYYAWTWLYNLPCLFLVVFLLNPLFAISLGWSHTDTSLFILHFGCLLCVTHLMRDREGERPKEWIRPRNHWILFCCLWTPVNKSQPHELDPSLGQQEIT